MENPMIEHGSSNHPLRGLITGLLLGILFGGLTMLLVAPQSGEKTRRKILNKSKEIREQTVETVEDAMTQLSTKTHQFTAGVHDKASELQQRGQDVLDGQKERLSAAVDSGNDAIQSALN